MIPGVRVAPFKPGDLTTALLAVQDELHRGAQEFLGKQASAEIQPTYNAASLRKYITTLLPMIGFMLFSSIRVTVRS